MVGQPVITSSDIANEENTIIRYPGFAEVLIGKVRCGKEEVGDAVGDHAVYLFGHRQIK